MTSSEERNSTAKTPSAGPETHDATSAVSMPLRATQMKVVSLSVRAAKSGSKFEKDGPFALEILKEAVELTRPWLKGVEEELEKLGVDLTSARESRKTDRRRGGLLAIVPGVANTCLKLFRGGGKEDGTRKVRLMRDMYASVHAGLRGAEEKVEQLERELAPRRRRRRRRRRHRSIDVGDANGEDAEEPQEREEETDAVVASGALPAEGSTMSSVKRLPRSASMETQVTERESQFDDGSRRAPSQLTRSISGRTGGSVARTHRSGDKKHQSGTRDSTAASVTPSHHGPTITKIQSKAHSSASRKTTPDSETHKVNPELVSNPEPPELEQALERDPTVASKKGVHSRDSKIDPPRVVSVSKSSTHERSPTRGLEPEGAALDTAKAVERRTNSKSHTQQRKDVDKGWASAGTRKSTASRAAHGSRASKASSSKVTPVSLPGSSRSGKPREEHVTPKTSINIPSPRSLPRRSGKSSSSSSGQASEVSRGRSKTSKPRLTEEYHAEVPRKDVNSHDPGDKSKPASEKGPATSKRRSPQQSCPDGPTILAPTWSFANLNSSKTSPPEGKQIDSREGSRSRVSEKSSSSRPTVDPVSEVDLSGPKKPEVPRKCHHRASTRSRHACSSAAWSCEITTDEDGSPRLDDGHVHKRPGGCS